MYEIYANDMLLHRSGSEKSVLLNPKLNLEINRAGSLSFDILPAHTYYDSMIKLKTNIYVYRDKNLIWSGRILTDSQKMNKVKTVTCEGDMNFLYDSIQRQHEYHNMSVKDYFTTLINNHNSQVEEDRQFVVGTVTVEDENDSLYRYSNYETTYDTIQDKLISRLGGYIYIEYKDGKKVISYLEEYPITNSQVVKFGKNIVDFSKVIDASDLFTCLIPLGSQIQNEESEEETNSTLEKRVDITSVNNGLDYIVNEEASKIFGLITKTNTWNDVTEPQNLLIKGRAYLYDSIKLKNTINLNAFDMSLINVDISKLTLGYTRIVVEPHDIDEFMQLSKQTLNITKPENDSITLGIVKKTLTDETASIDKNIQVVSTEVVENYVNGELITNINPALATLKSLIESTGSNILLQVSSEYMSKDDKQLIINGYTTAIEQSDKDITLKFNESINKTDKNLESYKTETSKYIRFKDGVVTLGEEGSSMQTQLSNTRLSFIQDGYAVAYISNNRLYITEALFMQKMSVGNATHGYYTWSVRGNGNLSLRYSFGGEE